MIFFVSLILCDEVTDNSINFVIIIIKAKL